MVNFLWVFYCKNSSSPFFVTYELIAFLRKIKKYGILPIFIIDTFTVMGYNPPIPHNTNTSKVDEMKKITKTTLKKWNACLDGFERFNELFPKGAFLKTASEKLIADGHVDWSNWLWRKCKGDKDYVEQTVAIAGWRGTATAGDEGVLSILFFDAITQKYRRKIALVGENGIKPNVAYKLDENGNFVEA